MQGEVKIRNKWVGKVKNKKNVTITNTVSFFTRT